MGIEFIILVFLNRFAIQAFHEVYEGTELFNEYQVDHIRTRINIYLNDSFSFFKTLAPNRITASQGMMYVKYKLYFEESIKVDQHFIENYLKHEGKDQFIYKFQKQYGDGYIQKKKV